MSGKWLSSHADDLLAAAGLLSLLSGVYLWFGLPPALIILGLALIYTGARLPIKVVSHEPD